MFQRLLYALEPKNEYPPVPGKVWPKAFERVFDPIVTLAYVAAATQRIRLGTSVLIMPFYQPVILAKQLATMRMGSEILNYNLYRDSTRSTIWGDGTGGSQTYTRSNPPLNQNINVNVFGRIPAGQDVSAGSYGATVTATIFF